MTENDRPSVVSSTYQRFGTVLLGYAALLAALAVLRVSVYGFTFGFIVSLFVCIFVGCAGASLRFRENVHSQSIPYLPISEVLLIASVLLVSLPLWISTYQTYQRSTNVWWQPDGVIQRYILQQTPIGTDEQGVHRWLAGQHAERRVDRVDAQALLERSRATGTPLPDAEHTPRDLVWVGYELHHHGFLFETHVIVEYNFDSSNRLRGVRVLHFADSL